MKLKITTTILLSFWVLNIFGQIQAERGITFSPTYTFNDKINEPPPFNFSVGVFTKYALRKKWGIGIGLEYQKQELYTTERVNCGVFGQPTLCEVPRLDNFQIAKIPIWLNVNLNYHSDEKIKANAIGGYGYGKLLNSKIKEEEYDLNGLIDNLHFGFIGIEFHQRTEDNFNLTFGGHLEITNIYDRAYGEVQNLKFIFRISK